MLSTVIGSIKVFAQTDSLKIALARLDQQNDSLMSHLANLKSRTESLELQNALIIKSLEAQLHEAENTSRFLEITLAVLGGLFGVIVAIITFARLKQDSWERGIQERRERQESGVVDALQKNVETVTNLMQIISKGQELAAFVKEAVERQKEQSKWFKDDLLGINTESEKMLKEGKLKRRMLRQREIQGEIAVLAERIEKIILLLPLVPFEKGEAVLSAPAYYVRAMKAFLDSDYTETRKLLREARHLEAGGDLLWQIPFYEGVMAKNEGNYELATISFEEAIVARQNADPELGSRTEIAEITHFKYSLNKNRDVLKKGMIETRNRCLEIILRAEGIEKETKVFLDNINIGMNPNMTEEYRRMEARCLLIAGNAYWAEEDFKNALFMYEKSSRVRESSVYALSSIGQALDRLDGKSDELGIPHDALFYYDKAFSALRARLGRYEEAQNRILRLAVFALCVKRLKESHKIEATWEPVEYRVQAERIVEDELRYKNRNIKLFSPFTRVHIGQDEFIDELRREIG
jgi:tetratricopeptide (TPR) repeat protein